MAAWSDIEWTDATWNPVTGCEHDCKYCYAKEYARRFGGYWLDGLDEKYTPGKPYDPSMGIHGMDCEPIEERELYTPQMYKTKAGKFIAAPIPYGFAPTLYRYRLDIPQHWRRPRTVFVGSLCDLFGEWVPEEWQKAVFDAALAAPQHRYMFLTKNPDGIPLSAGPYMPAFDRHIANFWFGVTVTNQRDLERSYKRLVNVWGNTFLSIEPLHGAMDFSRIDLGDVICNFEKGTASYLGGTQKVRRPQWVIIGAETGDRKDKVTPEREWVTNIVASCDWAGVPVLMKDSLIPIVGEENMRREFPWER